MRVAVCGAVVLDRIVTWAPRPSLGVLRFDDGLVVEALTGAS